MKRLCIYTKEISIILGISERSAQQLVRRIRDVYAISIDRSVTIREFCEYMELPYGDVARMIE